MRKSKLLWRGKLMREATGFCSFFARSSLLSSCANAIDAPQKISSPIAQSPRAIVRRPLSGNCTDEQVSLRDRLLAETHDRFVRLQVDWLREPELHLRSGWHPKRTNRNSGGRLSCCPRFCLRLERISLNWYGSSPGRNRSETYGKQVRAMPISSRCLNPAE